MKIHKQVVVYLSNRALDIKINIRILYTAIYNDQGESHGHKSAKNVHQRVNT